MSKRISMSLMSAAAALVVAATPVAAAADETVAESPAAALHARIDALRAPDVPWRAIAWRSCLLDGLLEARRSGKPLMLWVFIDRPIDDQRC